MVATKTAGSQVLQGIEVPAAAIDPKAFFAATRRLRYQLKVFNYAGLGLSDNVQVLQNGILSDITVRFSGSVTVTPGTGTVATTARWPYDLVRGFKFSANGQSNLINASGGKIKSRGIMQLGWLTDRGVEQSINGATVNQGTMSQHTEMWGVGQNESAITAGTYDVELVWRIPVAFEDKNLVGAIFAQTSATDLNLGIDWANLADLFTLTGDAAAALTGTVIVEATVCSIPQGQNGQIIVPDLSTFHAITQSRTSDISNGDNEIRLSGQGVGKQLMRLWFQTWNGSPAKPLAMNATNYGQVAWRFGGNDTPETFRDGRSMAYNVERLFDSDLGSLQGFGVFDFARENAFRDSVDEGTATELRAVINIASGVALSSPVVEYVQETLAVGAAV